MKFKKLLAIALSVSMVATNSVFAMESNMLKDGDFIVSTQEENYNISICEFIISIVTKLEGTQPMLMDTHYAHSYMVKAEELGLVDLNTLTMDLWGTTITSDLAKSILEKAGTIKEDVSIEDLKTAVLSLSAKNITLNGVEIDLNSKDIFPYNGVIMVPVRAVGEGLGFDVQWDSQTGDVSVDDGVTKTTFQLGFDNYYMASSTAIGFSNPTPLGAAPRLIDGSTYVPIGAFDILLNSSTFTVEDGVIKIVTDSTNN